MKVVAGRPPCYDEICKAIAVPRETAVFTWGDTVYTPDGLPLSVDLAAHEGTHIVQQREIGGPKRWWKRYIADPAFRLEQELAAYRAQYVVVCGAFKDRNVRAQFLASMGSDLAGPMYGRLMSFNEARDAIRRS